MLSHSRTFAARQTRVILVAGTLGLAIGLMAALSSLEERVDSLPEAAGVTAAGIAGVAAGIALSLLALRRESVAAAMIAIYVGAALFAVTATRASSEYETSIVLLLVGAGALLVIAYGLLVRRLLQPTGGRSRVMLALPALAGAISVASILVVTLPIVLISAWTWRATVSDD
jgi:hypothetical protein